MGCTILTITVHLLLSTLLKNFIPPSMSIFSPSVPENCTIKDLLSSRNFENREGRSQYLNQGFTFKVKDIILSQERRDKIQLFIYLFILRSIIQNL
ncbi:unnamed protein product [Rhizophagus irregularis]|nr:unnamed protein product [Rhizophagus irregularis]